MILGSGLPLSGDRVHEHLVEALFGSLASPLIQNLPPTHGVGVVSLPSLNFAPKPHKARTRALRREAAWARLKLDPKFADP